MEETQIITSRLWVFIQLTTASTWFPLLVQGAALSVGKIYDQALLAHVASRPEVLDAIQLHVQPDGITSPVDDVLRSLIVNAGAAVDATITAAVTAHS